MEKNCINRLVRVFVLTMATLLLMAAAPDIFALRAHGEALGSGKDVAAKINLRTLTVSINNEVVYDSARSTGLPSVGLTADSIMSFNLRWDVIGKGDGFRDGDYFSIPVVYVDGLRLTEPFIQTLELDGGGGKAVAVAVGRFTYEGGLLAFEVVFNKNAANYQIEGGPAGGYAELSISSGQTELPMTFGDNMTVTVDIDTEPGGVTPGLPTFPKDLPSMRKAVFSPEVSDGSVNLSTRYSTLPPSDERKFGLDWRLTFFDLDMHFQKGGAATENVIIEDIVGNGLKFSNFESYAASDRDKGFSPIKDEDYEAPFFIEIPIVAVGSNRVYNLHGADTLNASSVNGYIGTIIRADELRELSGADVAEQVRRQPLSWGIEALGGGREKLIINLGKLGPGVKKGQGLTADMVKEKDYPYAVLDGVIINEMLTAQRMIAAGGPDTEQWKRVRKESLNTILHYWPAYKDKLCAIAGISAGSSTDALEKALFAMTYDQMNRSKLATLGSDEKKAGGIAGTMRIDNFVLRYRTVFSSVADADISNSVKVTTGIITKEDSSSYRHQFYADIFGTVNAGEIFFMKIDESGGHRTGETSEKEMQDIRGLSGAEFELYEVSGGAPLRFTRDGSVYKFKSDGNVTVLLSDADGAFKITGLSPSKDYALYEKAAPAGYELPSDRYTVFRVSSSESTYFVITNRKIPDIPDIPDRPNSTGRSSGVDIRDTPETVEIPDTDVPLANMPDMGDNSNIQLALLLMLSSATVIVALLFAPYGQFRSKRNKKYINI